MCNLKLSLREKCASHTVLKLIKGTPVRNDIAGIPYMQTFQHFYERKTEDLPPFRQKKAEDFYARKI